MTIGQRAIWLQVEIDDFHDYHKALTAYNEALRCWQKAADGGGGGSAGGGANSTAATAKTRRERLNTTIKTIREFLAIQE